MCTGVKHYHLAGPVCLISQERLMLRLSLGYTDIASCLEADVAASACPGCATTRMSRRQKSAARSLAVLPVVMQWIAAAAADATPICHVRPNVVNGSQCD